MIIEGHFAGTRAKLFTDRDMEELREVYRRGYPFIRLAVDGQIQSRTENATYSKRFADLEAELTDNGSLKRS
jgi:hypothetical protein